MSLPFLRPHAFSYLLTCLPSCPLSLYRILRVQREAEEGERSVKTKKLNAAHEHMEELQAQILMNAEVRSRSLEKP